MTKTVYALIKFFKEEDEIYADSLLTKGEIFCQTLKSFREIEDNNIRGDKHEGSRHWIQPNGVNMRLTVQINSIPNTITLTEKDFAGPLVISTTEYDFRNIYCLYAITFNNLDRQYKSEDEKEKIINEINYEVGEESRIINDNLGSYAVLIYNVPEFINKIEEYIRINKVSLKHGLIGYFDDKVQNEPFNADEAIFRKRIMYSSQKEYRFAFSIENDGLSQLVRIGSLEGIAVKTTFRELQLMEARFEFQTEST
jgi:hypothetical protein